MILPHGETDLLKFIGDFNPAHPTISFSRHYSQDSVNFLNVSVSLSGGRLTTKLYRKPKRTPTSICISIAVTSETVGRAFRTGKPIALSVYVQTKKISVLIVR